MKYYSSDDVCEAKDCDARAVSRNYCRLHYGRWYRNGDPDLVKPRSGNKTPRPVVTERRCRSCQYIGPPEDFMPSRNLCRKCNSEQLAAWKKAHPEKTKEAKARQALKHEFRRSARRLGLDPDEMQERWEAHDGRCEICGTTPGEGERRLHMDHDHSNGEFRGFLCGNCNAGLGRFKDNREFLLAAEAYLALYERNLELQGIQR